jgi:hypothetical protein
LLNGNLESDGASGAWKFGIGTIPFPKSGKWYFEVQATAYSGNFGIAKLLSSSQINATIRDSSESTAVWYAFDGKVWSRYSGQGSTTGVQAGLTTFNNGDIVGFGVNVDDEEVKFYVNGSLQYTYSLPTQIAADLTAGRLFPIVDTYGGVNAICNFGQRAFSYPLSGFSPLATSFLPEPTIKRGDEAMDVALWTGNGSTQTISGLNHSPDLIWHKIRSIAGGHQLYDSVRGVSKRLRSDTSAVESTVNGVTAFNSDGWTMTGGNNDNENYVSWIWDAGDATTTIAAGGLNSSAYDQSQVWSSGMKTTSTANTSYSTTGRTTTFPDSLAATAPFDADLTNFLYSQTGTSGTWLYVEFGTALANVTSIIFSTEYSCPGGVIKLNGTDVAVDQSNLGGGFVEVSVTGTIPASLNEIAIQGNSGSARLKYLKINGRYLIDSGVTPTNVPSIATTVRARPEAGFSIMTYEASGTAGATVAHQLGKAPEFMIGKNRDYGQNWFMFHKTVGAGGGFNFNVNTAAYTTDTGYAWTSVEGYSSFGSYEGSNSSTPFIYTGFSPRWILIANMDNVSDFVIYDTARNANNQSGTVLASNSANGEGSYSSGYELDILSNGFKVRTSSSVAINQNAHTHVYAAFSSHPFASNARAR